MKSLKFEFKRFFFSKKNLVMLFLLIFVLLVPPIFQEFGAGNFDRNWTLQSIRAEVSTNSKQYQEALKSNQQNQSDKAQTESVATIKAALDKSKKKLEAFQNQNYTAYWKLYISDLTPTLSEEEKFNKDIPKSESAFFDLPTNQINYYRYIIDHHLYFYSSEVALTKSFEGVSLQFLNALNILPILLMIILSVSFFADAFENQTLRFYTLIKKSKKEILAHHFFIPFFSFLVIMVGIFSLFYILFGMLRGWGTPIYPYGQSSEYLTPFWRLDLLQLLFLVLTLGFVITLGQLLTVIFKKTLVAVGVESILFIGYFLLSTQNFFQPFKRFLPFPYLNSLGTLIADKNVLFGNATFLIGATYLLISIIVFWGLSRIIFERYIFRKVGRI